jgi:Fur family ferric uptake transcriptional regulator
MTEAMDRSRHVAEEILEVAEPDAAPTAEAGVAGPWADVREQLRSRGLRWTPQRRLILEVLGSTTGHVTGSEIVERCRERDPETTPSTVYRTLDVLEELGYLHHSHGPDGREEFHVLPASEHAHLSCERCGGSWEVPSDEAAALVGGLERTRGFRVHLGHLTVSGVCADCLGAASAVGTAPA